MKASLLAPLFGLGWESCKVCTAAQPYNGAWYHPMTVQHSTAPLGTAPHTLHMAQVLVIDAGETLIGYTGMVLSDVLSKAE